MILVLIFLAIIILFFILITILVLSTIQIEVNNLELKSKSISNIENREKYIKISLMFLDKYKIFSRSFNDKKIKKIYTDVKYKKVDFNKVKEKIKNNYNNKEIIKILKKLKFRISKLNLRIDLGVEDVIFTSYINAFISTVIGIILPRLIKRKDIYNCKYSINPLYRNINEYYVKLDSIINVKIVHIIYIIYILLKEGRDKNERSPNRRSYAYSYERN